jgi:hypothetical protein
MNIMTARMIADNFGITVSADDAPKLIAAIQNAYATGRRDESTLLANSAKTATKFTENQDSPVGECGVSSKSGELQDDDLSNYAPNHLCKGKMIHLPYGEACDRCGFDGGQQL